MGGDHVWRNEESGLLMLRTPIIRNNNWLIGYYNQKRGELTGKRSLYYPCFQTHAWTIVKWPCKFPQLALTHGTKQVDYRVKYKGFRRGFTFASFCDLPEELDMDFAKRDNAHLPPTSTTVQARNVGESVNAWTNCADSTISDLLPEANVRQAITSLSAGVKIFTNNNIEY